MVRVSILTLTFSMCCPVCLRNFQDQGFEVWAYPCGYLTCLECRRRVFEEARQNAYRLCIFFNNVGVECQTCGRYCSNKSKLISIYPRND